MSTLAAFLFSITGTLAARAMLSLGIGIVSFAALTTLANALIVSMQAYYGDIPTTVLQLIGLGGIGDFLAMITSAVIVRLSLVNLKRFRIS